MTAKTMAEVISDEAVEAAARVSHALRWPDAPWDAMNDRARTYVRKNARAALEAAAPFIRAQALEEAADALDSDYDSCLYLTRRRELAYPYSKPMLAEQWAELDGIEEAAQFIRARAAAERGGADACD